MKSDYKGVMISLCFFVVLSCKKQEAFLTRVETDVPIFEGHSVKINEVITGYYSGIPAHYNERSDRFPLLLFIPGGAQVGDGNSELHTLLYGGVPKMLSEHKFPSSFIVNGKEFSFIILTPQFKRKPSNEHLRSFIEFAFNNYRIDLSRVYIMGISAGGRIACDVASEYGSLFAALIPIAGISTTQPIQKCKLLRNANLPIWIFQNKDDEYFEVGHARKFVEILDSIGGKIRPKYTEFSPYGLGGHDAWTMATDPSYKEDNMNVYEWMLQYSR